VDWPAEWQARYLAKDYVRDDPAVLHLGRTILPYTWADLLNCPDYKKAERQIVLEAREFSLNSGLIVPLPALRSGSAILTIAGCDVEVSPTDSAEIHLAAIYAHKHLRDIVRPEPPKSLARFTERERECLHWVAAGKSDWQISEILSLSVKTVNFHIENAKKKFGVATRVQAVALAIRERVILP
jgi:LuxR family quorum sensing-dependent transcriptional regulator